MLPHRPGARLGPGLGGKEHGELVGVLRRGFGQRLPDGPGALCEQRPVLRHPLQRQGLQVPQHELRGVERGGRRRHEARQVEVGGRRAQRPAGQRLPQLRRRAEVPRQPARAVAVPAPAADKPSGERVLPGRLGPDAGGLAAEQLAADRLHRPRDLHRRAVRHLPPQRPRRPLRPRHRPRRRGHAPPRRRPVRRGRRRRRRRGRRRRRRRPRGSLAAAAALHSRNPPGVLFTASGAAGSAGGATVPPS